MAKQAHKRRKVILSPLGAKILSALPGEMWNLFHPVFFTVKEEEDRTAFLSRMVSSSPLPCWYVEEKKRKEAQV